MGSQERLKIKALKAKAKAGIENLTEEEKKELAKMEAKYKKIDQERFQKKADKDKLEFADKEMRTKAEQGENRLGREKERAQKKVDKIKQQGAATAARAARDAQNAGNLEMQKIQVAEALKAGSEQENKADALKAKTRKKEVEEEKKSKEVKKKFFANMSEHEKELHNKKKAFRENEEVIHKKDEKREKVALAKQKAKNNQVRKEFEQKHIIARTERGEKIAAKAALVSKIATQRAAAIKAMRAEDKKYEDAEATKLKASKDTTAKAIHDRIWAIGHEKNRAQKAMQDGIKKVFDTKADLTGIEVTEKAREKNLLEAARTAAHDRIYHGTISARKEGKQKRAGVFHAEHMKAKPEMNREDAKLRTAQQKVAALRHQQLKIQQDGNRAYQNAYTTAQAKISSIRHAAEMKKKHAVMVAEHAKEKGKKVAAHDLAKGDAQARMIVAEENEKQEKVKAERKKEAERVYGIVELDIRADVAAHVDSGKGMPGMDAKIWCEKSA